MPYTIEKLQDKNIIVHRILAGAKLEEMEGAFAETITLLDQQSDPAFLIYDFTEFSMSLDDLMRGAKKAARGSNAVLHHPMVRENVYVTMDGMMNMAFKGLRSATFGQVRVSVFTTLDHALEYCRSFENTLGF